MVGFGELGLAGSWRRHLEFRAKKFEMRKSISDWAYLFVGSTIIHMA